MKKITRAHEWLADRVSFIQYPNLRPADAHTRSHHGMRWKHSMPWEVRLTLAVLSAAAVVIALLTLMAMVFIAYKAIF